MASERLTKEQAAIAGAFTGIRWTQTVTDGLIIGAEDGPWTFPATVECLPKEVKSYAEKARAPRRQYIRADLAAVREAAAYERAASLCSVLEYFPQLSAIGSTIHEDLANDIRALATDDQTDALEAVKREAREKALREATVMELLEELKSRHDPPVTGLENVNMIEKGQDQ